LWQTCPFCEGGSRFREGRCPASKLDPPSEIAVVSREPPRRDNRASATSAASSQVTLFGYQRPEQREDRWRAFNPLCPRERGRQHLEPRVSWGASVGSSINPFGRRRQIASPDIGRGLLLPSLCAISHPGDRWIRVRTRGSGRRSNGLRLNRSYCRSGNATPDCGERGGAAAMECLRAVKTKSQLKSSAWTEYPPLGFLVCGTVGLTHHKWG
jgi:hypothetical protein